MAASFRGSDRRECASFLQAENSFPFPSPRLHDGRLCRLWGQQYASASSRHICRYSWFRNGSRHGNSTILCASNRGNFCPGCSVVHQRSRGRQRQHRHHQQQRTFHCSGISSVRKRRHHHRNSNCRRLQNRQQFCHTRKPNTADLRCQPEFHSCWLIQVDGQRLALRSKRRSRFRFYCAHNDARIFPTAHRNWQRH